ncbi:MAG: vitamin B12-dependent ribonucleotide reductase, partial [Boseongicola sp.]|nr:vitamin B12-dependent ribonucleotide reductase [Boseongicola sp.]
TSILDYIFRELAVSYLDRTDLAHVKPEGVSFDDLGRGEDEGKRNFKEVEGANGEDPVEVLRKVVSTGYLRNRAPQGLMVVQGGAGATALDSAGDAVATLETVVAEVKSETAIATGTVSMDARTKAKMQGYEGDPCGDCGNYTLVRNGTCMKCNTCGATSGCS